MCGGGSDAPPPPPKPQVVKVKGGDVMHAKNAYSSGSTKPQQILASTTDQKRTFGSELGS